MKKILSIILVVIMTFSLVALVYSASDNEEQSTKNIEQTVKAQEIIKLSLKEAIDYALENSRDMKIQELNVDKANEIKKQEKSNIKKAPDMSLEMKKKELGVSEREAELSFQTAKWNKEITINQIKYNVEKAYYDLKQIQKEREIAKENLELAQKQYEQGQKKHELGSISKQQLLSIELDVSKAQSIYDTANMDYEINKMNFNDILGLSLKQNVVLTEEIEVKESEEINIEDSIKEALENNARIKIAHENYEISKILLQAISARYPEKTYKYKEQEISVQQMTKNLESAKTITEMRVRTAYLKFLNSKDQISTFNMAVKNAQKSFDLSELSFKLGQSTLNDVTYSRIELMNAKRNLSKQIYDYNMALLDFKYSLGIGKE